MTDEEKKAASEELLAKTTENFEKTFGDEFISESGSTPKVPAEPTPDPESKEKEAEPGESESTPDLEPEPNKEDGSGKEAADDKPELSDAYYRAAKHVGWSDEDINNLYENNSDLCVSTLGKVYDELNRASQDFAAIGRARKEAARVPAVEPTPASTVESDYEEIDVEALEKAYPDDPALVKMMVAQDKQSKMLYDQIQELKNRPESAVNAANQREQSAMGQEARAIEQQIDTFFKSDEAQAYSDFYGSLPKDAINWDSLTPGQRANRWAVLTMMDQMLAGAQDIGKEMGIGEALELAHLSTSESEREKVVRGKIIKDIKKRDKGLTLEPASSANTDTRTGKMTREELIDVTQKRMNKVFG